MIHPRARRSPRLAAWALAAAAVTSLLGTSSAQAASASASSSPSLIGARALEPIDRLDVPGYLGRWYQVAAVPQPFTLQCARDVVADYGYVDADTISVRNSCRTYLGRLSTIEGTADVVDPVTQAQLRVRFPSVPFGQEGDEPNYVVAHLAADGSWALVGDPARRSGFVLSRKPALTRAQWDDVKRVIAAEGYATWRFVTTPQTGGDALPQLLSTR